MEYSDLFVVLMGVGTVFFGLICLIALVWVMGKLFRSVDAPPPARETAPKAAPSNGGEVVAAISAAIAEELGTDVSAFRIVSIKKL
jgi:sodium pump decarboxylase gamma subunit